MLELEDLIQCGIAPALEKRLEAKLGQGWRDQLNREFTTPKGGKNTTIKPVNKLPDGSLDWDFNRLLHGVQFLFGGPRDTSKYSALAKDLRDLRNNKSHAGPGQMRQAANHERTFKFLRSAEELLKWFRADEEHRRVVELISEYENHLYASRSSGDKQENAQRQSETAQSNTGEQSTKDTQEPAQGKAEPNFQFEQTVKRPTRTTGLPDPGSGHVWFPIIGEGVDEYAYFRVSKNKEPQPHVLANAPGMDESRKRALLQVIDAIRHDEQDDSLSSSTTRFRFGGEFIGPSFGIAAAFADRSARYGISSQIRDTTIVATGAILPNKRGEVGQIDGLLEKMRFIETSPDSRKAGKLLFVFPQANLVGASQGVREILTRWTSASSPIQWRAIAHIDDLNDLLGTGQADHASMAEPKPADETVENTKQVATVEIAVDQSSEESSNPEISQAKPNRFRRWLTTGVAAGVLAAAIVGGVGIWVQQSRVDPAVLQASDNRLTAVVKAADSARASTNNLDLCNKVGHEADNLTDFDKQRLTDDAANALAYWQSCHDQFSASDGRRSELVRLAVNAKSGNEDRSALARAASQITPFDLSRDQTSAIQDALSLGKEAIAAVDASRSRLVDFSAAWTQFQGDRENFQNRLQAALDKITPQDEKLANGGEASEIKLARQYFTDKQQSAERIAALKSSAKQYQLAPSYKTAKAFALAYDQMGNEDQSTLLSALSDLAPDAGIADARRRLDTSTKRLGDVSRTYEVVKATEPSGTLRFSSLIALRNAANAITDFDRSGLDDKGYAAITKAADVSNILAESDQRISQARGNAMSAMLRNYNVSTSLFKNIQFSIGLLQALDIDRLSPDERSMISRACNAQPALAPGAVAPEINLSCRRF